MRRSLRLDHCVIHVSDWEVSNAFYRDVLGAEVVRVGEGWAYRFGEQQLNVHGPGVRVHDVARLPVQPGNSDICFEWDGDIDDAAAYLRDLGVDVESGPAERPGARGTGCSVYFRDPDGSLLEFISYRRRPHVADEDQRGLLRQRTPVMTQAAAKNTTTNAVR